MNGPGPVPRIYHAADGLHLDARGMAPPGPMVAILSLIERGEAGDAFVVHLDRDPVFLYPELAERGFEVRQVDGEPGEVRLAIERVRP